MLVFLQENIVHIVMISLNLVIILFTLRVFNNKLSRGQARAMGVTNSIYFWIVILFIAFLLESVFGLYSYIAELPILLDLLFYLILCLGLGILYFVLKQRNTFKPLLFVTLILVPFGVHGVFTIGKVLKVGLIETAPKLGVISSKKTIESKSVSILSKQLLPQMTLADISKNYFNKFSKTKKVGLQKNLLDTIDKIKKHQKGENVKFKHNNSGSKFGNYEKKLPKSGEKYTEYTVDTPNIRHPGTRRIVTGSDGKWYYTDDHYKTFVEMKGI